MLPDHHPNPHTILYLFDRRVDDLTKDKEAIIKPDYCRSPGLQFAVSHNGLSGQYLFPVTVDAAFGAALVVFDVARVAFCAN